MKFFFVFLAVFLLVQNAFASCSGYNQTFFSSGGSYSQCQSIFSNRPLIACSGMVGGYWGNGSLVSGSCNSCYARSDESIVNGSNPYNASCTWQNCFQCSTEAEADSLNCVLNPTADGCVTCEEVSESRCKNEYGINNGVGTWYAVEYIDKFKVCSDGTETLLSTTEGSVLPNVDCSENPFGSSADSTLNFTCMGMIGGTCLVQVSPKEQFTCPCDIGCSELYTPGTKCAAKVDSVLASKYSSSSAASSSSDSEDSSSSGSESSASGTSSSGGSGSGEGGSSASGSGENFIDYTGYLTKIKDTLDQVRDNTAATAIGVNSINNTLQQNQTSLEADLSEIGSKIDAVGDSVSSLKDTIPGTGNAEDKVDSLLDFADSLRGEIANDSGYVDVTIPSDSLYVDTSEVQSTLNSSLGITNTTPSGCLTISFDMWGGQMIKGNNKTSYSSDSLKLKLCSLGSSQFNFMDFLRKLMAAGLGVFTVSIWAFSFKSAFGAAGD